ncbi:MAG: hypothetical protein K2K77_01075, partial [Duncaniella sp.]|nr:hypothetical protein [Duncaniella sp.]
MRFVSTVTMIVCCLSVMAQTRSVKTPDFAYPKTVSANARKSLDKAMHAGDTQGILRSLIDYTLAQGSTGTANLPGCIALIDSVGNAASPGDDAVLRGMLPMLKAVIYNNVYSGQRWKYDGRTSVSLLPLPEDYTEWSGEQFRHRIAGLIDIALADSVALRAIPLKNYTGVITQDRMTAVYYPTLYHFVARQAIDILQGFGAVP